MKVPLSWLENYVQLPPVRELLPRLTEIGHMVDGVVRLPDGQCIVSLEIRTNRPDCLSILGIAREVSAAFATPVREVRLADLPHKFHQSAAEGPDYVLRPSLVPNMLSSSRFLPLLVGQRRLFEIGRTFHSVGGKPVERRTAAWVIMMGSSPANWHQTCQPDFYTMKAEVEAMLDALGLYVFSETSSPIPFPFLVGKSCCLLDKSGKVVGYVGEVDHRAYRLKLVRKSFAVEIYLPAPSLRQAKRVSTPRREVDSFDISVLVDENTKVSTIQELVGETLGQDLVAMRLIDIYTGEQVEAGSRSFTFRIVYARSRGEPGMILREIVSIITQRLHAGVRGTN